MGRTRLRAAAVLLAALLLWLISGAALSEAPELDQAPEDAGAEAMPGELGGLDLAALAGEDEAPTPAPEVTVAPTKAPDGAGWHTSLNYPEGKVSFENEIWAILTGRWGLADFQAAGLMGSIAAESAFCPYNVQGRGGSDDRGGYVYRAGDSVGFGLCQWTSAGRKQALLSYARAHGSPDLVWDFDIQMGFLAGELDLGALKATRTMYEAAEWVTMTFERPSQALANSWPGNRYRRAMEIYRAHTGRDYDEPKLRFSVKYGDTALHADGCALVAPGAPGPAGTLAVKCNYYWRMEQVDGEGGEWLRITARSAYGGGDWERCDCGYLADGAKALRLEVVKAPPLGVTYRTTLHFTLYRGDGVSCELPLTLTTTVGDVFTRWRRADWRCVALGVAIALWGVG